MIIMTDKQKDIIVEGIVQAVSSSIQKSVSDMVDASVGLLVKMLNQRIDELEKEISELKKDGIMGKHETN